MLVVLALAVVAYILRHQPSFTLGKSYYTVKAEFSTAAAVVAGQGEAVTIAGVQVGQVGGVDLQDGHAVVTMNIFKKYEPIYRDATVLLRPRTPLKDMYLALDPGTKNAGAIPANGVLGAANTNPDIDFDQILSSLDVDSRNYLLLLLAGGAQAFHDTGATGAAPSPAAVADLRGTFKRFAPLSTGTRVTLPKLPRDPPPEHRACDPQPQPRGEFAGRRRGPARLADQRLEHELHRDLHEDRAAPGRACTLLPGTLQHDDRRRSARCGGSRTRARPHSQALLPFAHALGPGAARLAPAVPRHDAGDQEPAASVLGRGPAAGRVLEPASTKLALATSRR